MLIGCRDVEPALCLPPRDAFLPCSCLHICEGQLPGETRDSCRENTIVRLSPNVFPDKLRIQEITSVWGEPGEKVFFPITALQVTVETQGPGKHGRGSFTSIGPHLSPIGPEAPPTSLWITADLNQYHLQGRRQKARNNLNCPFCQADLRLIVPVSA